MTVITRHILCSSTSIVKRNAARRELFRRLITRALGEGTAEIRARARDL